MNLHLQWNSIFKKLGIINFWIHKNSVKEAPMKSSFLGIWAIEYYYNYGYLIGTDIKLVNNIGCFFPFLFLTYADRREARGWGRGERPRVVGAPRLPQRRAEGCWSNESPAGRWERTQHRTPLRPCSREASPSQKGYCVHGDEGTAFTPWFKQGKRGT